MPVSNSENIPVQIVGGSTFGRYSKISAAKTVNLYISDEWLVNYPGFKKQSDIGADAAGRGLFNSIRGNFLLAVMGNKVYRFNTNLVAALIGTIETSSGDVSIDENLAGQICIVDGVSAWIYNYKIPTPNFNVQVLNIPPEGTTFTYNVTPGYVCYHNKFFLISSALTSPFSFKWYAFETDPGNLQNIKYVLRSNFSIQTKPDVALLVKRLPGRGSNVLVLGSSCGEVWTNIGGLENYRKIQSFNIDNGIVSISTIASNEEMVCWLAKNESNAPFIMVSDGSNATRISSDGIDHLMDQLNFPDQSSASLFRQDGHLFYQLTFYNPADNLTLFYDFTSKLFSHATDERLNFHPARKIAFFNNENYFVSLNDGSLYRMNTDLVTYDYNIEPGSIGEEIPRIRVCNTIRKPNSGRFRIGEFSFTVEQGMPYKGPFILHQVPGGPDESRPILPRIDVSFSVDGNATFSNVVSRELNPVAIRRNQLRFQRMGQANEFTVQIRFYGFTRLVCNNGFAIIY